MKELIVEDIIRLCDGKLICGEAKTILKNFCKDTRDIKSGDVFVGIKGDSHNGNELYETALQNGASVCILQDIVVPNEIKEKYSDRAIVIVKDTIAALQKLATYKRDMYDIPVVAITGSVGKTSTKDIVASVMSKKYDVLKTEGNFNSQIGAALTVLRLKNHTAMVVELGMNNLGEISRLTKMVKPTVAVITNVGTSHIGILGSRQNILKAKLEILEGLKKGGKFVINNDNDLLHDWYINSNNKYDVVTYGMENKSEFCAYNTEIMQDGSKYLIDVGNKTYKVHVKVGGNHFISNSLCAITIGNIFNIKMEDILDAINNFELTKRRMQVEKLENDNIIINDCYNANLDSMKAAIEYLSHLENTKIAVLGDMLELGNYSEDLHRQVGDSITKNNIDILITVGKESKYIADQALKNNMEQQKIYILDTNKQATKLLKDFLEQGKVSILLKASNAMKFQEIFDSIYTKNKEGN